jgi:hypothetical protein
MLKEYYSRPVAVKAIELTKDNIDDVVNIIKLNRGMAEKVNLDVNGEVAGPGIITAYRGLSIRQDDGSGGWLVCKPGEFIVIGASIYPVNAKLFKEYHADSIGEIDDSYHSFDQLYSHRIELYIALCKKIDKTEHGRVWRSKKHSDDSEYKGWFILGINRDPGSQITYHLPDSRWDDCEFAFLEDKAPTWDQHTPDDVIARIKDL